MISYEPLYKMMKQRGLLWKDVKEGTGCSPGTMAKITHGVPVSLDVIDRLCAFFQCHVEDVIQYVEDKN